VSDTPSTNVVSVMIAGEEYTLRAMATPEHALRCAALVDEAVRQVLAQSSLVQPQKAAILAALSLADQLLQTQTELTTARDEGAAFARRLAADLERRLVAEP
jgi:cell division protein ZapA (FtsZ GTPase activity inhibitor)